MTEGPKERMAGAPTPQRHARAPGEPGNWTSDGARGQQNVGIRSPGVVGAAAIERRYRRSGVGCRWMSLTADPTCCPPEGLCLVARSMMFDYDIEHPPALWGIGRLRAVVTGTGPIGISDRRPGAEPLFTSGAAINLNADPSIPRTTRRWPVVPRAPRSSEPLTNTYALSAPARQPVRLPVETNRVSERFC